MDILYPLHGRNGDYLRSIPADELGLMVREMKAEVEWTRRGKIKRARLSDGKVMVRFPRADGNFAHFREHVAEAWYVWAHSRQAFAWNNA